MNNFDTVFRGYDKEQVKKYLDNVIKEYERLLNDKKDVDRKVSDLEEKLKYYTNLEDKFTRAIITAENAGDEIKKVARNEAETLINDALIKAEKANDEADRLKRNTTLLKRRLKAIIESQLEVIEEMDRLNFKDEDRY